MSKFGLLTTVLLLSGSAVASIVTPNCRLSWSWSFNSLGQNACTVAAYLLSTCNAGSFTFTSLAPGDSYPGPSGPDDTNLCKCNTVVYNLMSACDGCQSGAWITWSQYSLNCTKTLPPSTFPNLVPAGTRVPQWALLDPTPQNNWDNITAFAAGDNPELAPGAMIGPSNTSTSYLSYPEAASSVPSTSPSPSSSNAGAVVGGVIGGIATVSIVIVAVVYYARRRRPRAPSALFMIDEASFRWSVDEARQSRSPGPSYMPIPTLGTPTMIRPLDQNDPTTFPGYPGSPVTSNGPAPTYNTIGSNLATMRFSYPPRYSALST